MRSVPGQRTAFVLCLAVMLSGCQVRERAAEPFAVDLLAITPQNISLVNQKLHLTVDVLNPGPKDRVLAHLVYVLTIDGEVFARGRIQGIHAFRPGAVHRVRLPVTTNLEGLGQLLVARRTNAPFHLSGYIVRAYTPGKFHFEQHGLVGNLDLRPAAKAKPGL